MAKNEVAGSGPKAYAELAKSGIVTLVLISVLGGYLAGQPFDAPFNWIRLFLTLFGILFLASGSSALNQYQERTIDASMPRTAKRPLPSGRLTERNVLLFIATTLVLGLGILAWLDRAQLVLGIIAVVSYNGLYTLWWKRHWAFAAVPGAIPGALPIWMGHLAANGHLFTAGGIYLFLLLFFWQMPHFWVLALKYREDYESGGFPTLPVAHGTGLTVSQIAVWCLAYIAISLIAPIFLRLGMIYLLVAPLMGFKLLWELKQFVRQPESKRWLHFFLWVNFSLIIYLAAAVIDLWSVYLIPYFTQGAQS